MAEYPKYRSADPVEIENRQWPSRRITAPPVWASVDLRDGNQAFIRPMDVAAKLHYFQMLAQIGFREIEVGYPAASKEEFAFLRQLIEEGQIPENVRISVLTAARPDLIERTIEAIRGVNRATIHCYAATSELHRRFVFNKSEQEEFSDSRLGFVVDLAAAVEEAWASRGKEDFILNLPETVERRPPYEYADMVEAFVRRYPAMERTMLSVHTHNDQGGAVAAAEMAVLAGAERVEGTLLGHGERTGNMDLVTFALNLKSRGVEPGLDFHRLPEIVEFIEEVSGISVHPRAPYAGELVFTAFSGTHQDAIRKGLAQQEAIAETFHQGWKVPYLHLDPRDVGRSHDGLIRINSQSGKGGVAYVLENVYGIEVPKAMQPQVAAAVQQEAERSGGELAAPDIHRIFLEKFVEPSGRIELKNFRIQRPAPTGIDQTGVELALKAGGSVYAVIGTGGGPIEAAAAALRRCPAVPPFRVEAYSEHALGRGSDARAIAFIGLKTDDGKVIYGAGVHENVNIAAITAMVNALNRFPE